MSAAMANRYRATVYQANPGQPPKLLAAQDDYWESGLEKKGKDSIVHTIRFDNKIVLELQMSGEAVDDLIERLTLMRGRQV